MQASSVSKNPSSDMGARCGPDILSVPKRRLKMVIIRSVIVISILYTLSVVWMLRSGKAAEIGRWETILTNAMAIPLALWMFQPTPNRLLRTFSAMAMFFASTAMHSVEQFLDFDLGPWLSFDHTFAVALIASYTCGIWFDGQETQINFRITAVATGILALLAGLQRESTNGRMSKAVTSGLTIVALYSFTKSYKTNCKMKNMFIAFGIVFLAAAAAFKVVEVSPELHDSFHARWHVLGILGFACFEYAWSFTNVDKHDETKLLLVGRQGGQEFSFS
jgi:predicted membrane channel-forming protein YqfA (hemolysin III family)